MYMTHPLTTITSPTMPVDSGIVHTPKEFSDNLTMDLTDSEIQEALKIIMSISHKWQTRFRYEFNNIAEYTQLGEARMVEKAAKLIDQFEHELHETLAERLDLIATVDMAPVFDGQPPVVELIGALSSHPSAKYGMDHERKSYEVKLSKERGEAFLGEKYSLNPGSVRKNAARSESNRKRGSKQ